MALHGNAGTRIHSFVSLFLLGFLSLIICCAPWFYGLTSFQNQLFAEIVIFVFFLIFFFSLSEDFRNRIHLYPQGMDFFILLTLALAACYVVFSTLPYYSFLAFIRLLSVVVLYFLVRIAVRSENVFYLFLWVFLLSGIGYSIYGLLQYFGYLPHGFWYQPHSLASRYVNGGHFAGLLLMPIFMGLSLLCINRKMVVKLALLFALMIMFWALVLSQARTVWISVALGLILFLALLGRKQLLTRKSLIGMMSVGFVGLVLLVKTGGWRVISERFGQLWSGGALNLYSIDYRFHLWGGSFRAIMERPWGWGLGTFGFVFPQFRVQADRFMASYAHNEFFQTGVDLGILGILLILGFVFVYFRRAFVFLGSEAGRTHKITACAFISCMFSIVLTSQFDFPLRIYSTGLLFAMFIALSTCLYGFRTSFDFRKVNTTAAKISARSWNIIRFISLIVVLACGMVAASQLSAQIHYKNGQIFESEILLDQAETEFRRAVDLAPFYSDYREALADIYRAKIPLAISQKQEERLRQQAIYEYKQAIRFQPFKATNFYILAFLYERAEDMEKGNQAFKKAILLEPQNPLFYAEYGYFAIRHGMKEVALDSFEKFNSLDPYIEGRRYVPCEMLEQCYQVTQDYEDLKRVIRDDWASHWCLAYLFVGHGRWDIVNSEIHCGLEYARSHYSYNIYQEHVRPVVINLYLKYDRFNDLFEILETDLKEYPEDQETVRQISQIRQKMENFKQG